MGGVGGLCEGPRWSGGGGGGGLMSTLTYPYIFLTKVTIAALVLGPIVYTDHIHTEDSKLPHSKPTFRPYLLVTLN